MKKLNHKSQNIIASGKTGKAEDVIEGLDINKALGKYELIGCYIRLTKRLLFDLDRRHIVIPIAGDKLARRVASVRKRESQWQRLKESKRTQRDCMVFDTTQTGDPGNPTELVEFMKGSLLLCSPGFMDFLNESSSAAKKTEVPNVR